MSKGWGESNGYAEDHAGEASGSVAARTEGQVMMPYIITTTTPEMADHITPGQPWPRTITSTAVATLDEAIEFVNDDIYRQEGELRADQSMMIDDLPESGGTIGPLPDGTVIEVRPS